MTPGEKWETWGNAISELTRIITFGRILHTVAALSRGNKPLMNPKDTTGAGVRLARPPVQRYRALPNRWPVQAGRNSGEGAKHRLSPSQPRLHPSARPGGRAQAMAITSTIRPIRRPSAPSGCGCG